MDIDEINRRAQEFRHSKNLDARHKELLRLLDEALAMYRRLDERYTKHLQDEQDQLREQSGE